jgi:hypothetical protein
MFLFLFLLDVIINNNWKRKSKIFKNKVFLTEYKPNYQNHYFERLDNYFPIEDSCFLNLYSDNIDGGAIYIITGEQSRIAKCGFFFCGVYGGNGGAIYLSSLMTLLVENVCGFHIEAAGNVDGNGKGQLAYFNSPNVKFRFSIVFGCSAVNRHYQESSLRFSSPIFKLTSDFQDDNFDSSALPDESNNFTKCYVNAGSGCFEIISGLLSSIRNSFFSFNIMLTTSSMSGFVQVSHIPKLMFEFSSLVNNTLSDNSVIHLRNVSRNQESKSQIQYCYFGYNSFKYFLSLFEDSHVLIFTIYTQGDNKVDSIYTDNVNNYFSIQNVYDSYTLYLLQHSFVQDCDSAYSELTNIVQSSQVSSSYFRQTIQFLNTNFFSSVTLLTQSSSAPSSTLIVNMPQNLPGNKKLKTMLIVFIILGVLLVAFVALYCWYNDRKKNLQKYEDNNDNIPSNEYETMTSPSVITSQDDSFKFRDLEENGI